MQAAVDDSAWEKRDLGIWSLPDHANVKHAVMRRKFTVPSGWTSGYVGLCVAQHAGIFVDGGRIFIDGQALRPAFYRDGIYLDPAKGLLKPGTSHVLALDIKSKQFGGRPAGKCMDLLPSGAAAAAEPVGRVAAIHQSPPGCRHGATARAVSGPVRKPQRGYRSQSMRTRTS